MANGSFNPAIFHPRWLADKELIAGNAADDALEKTVVSPQMATFTADWLSVQVTVQQAVFATVEEGRELELRDLALGVFDVLPETPIGALGINGDVHFRVQSEEAWHALGDKFLPRETDLERLAAVTRELYLAAMPSLKRVKKDPAVNKLVQRLHGEKIEELRGWGHVRARRTGAEDNWRVELGGDAVAVS
ncbi:MAG: hypothetical protein QOK31_322 [Solirubrobacteraceae bacterium]|nr:hypothetical protein [Solirubrobacteraceae bacterium]